MLKPAITLLAMSLSLISMADSCPDNVKYDHPNNTLLVKSLQQKFDSKQIQQFSAQLCLKSEDMNVNELDITTSIVDNICRDWERECIGYVKSAFKSMKKPTDTQANIVVMLGNYNADMYEDSHRPDFKYIFIKI